MRRTRSTRTEIVDREVEQAKIVAELIMIGADDSASKVTRCWHDRLVSDPGQHRYRCRSVACRSCRRPPIPAWWRSYLAWCQDGGATSYLRLSVDHPLVDVSVIAKSIRNLRDRLVREESELWAEVAILGVADGEHVHILVSHPGIARCQVERRLWRLWPKKLLHDAPTMPVASLDAPMLARLGARGRGFQPLRFQVLPSSPQ